VKPDWNGLLAGPPGVSVASRRPRILPRSPGRNARCPCGSGRKYKHCCLDGNTRRRVDAAGGQNGETVAREGAARRDTPQPEG
jgi:hypothetical protein